MGDAGRRGNPPKGGSKGPAEDADPHYVPPSVAGGRMAGVEAARSDAASQIQRTMRVWRKSQEGGAEGPAKPEEQGAEAGEAEAAGAESGEEAQPVAAKLDGGVARKIYRAEDEGGGGNFSPEQLALIRQFFGTSVAGAQARLANFQVPAGLTKESVQKYMQIAQAAIDAKKDTLGVQAMRLQLCQRALSVMK